ncbi:MAG: 2,3-bisphosphoglycerate-dependent phosphoglycerate mutase [Elusimicrobiota bacterium]
MAELVLLRHGQSQWNLENRFTGWVDVAITERGAQEAKAAALSLSKTRFAAAFTSALLRARQTLDIILMEIGQTGIPVFKDAALNERHYGDLQGLDKSETAKKYGEEQVHLWRRSYEIKPPGGESLKDTAERTLPYFNARILPMVREGKNILVCAHGNSLRAVVMAIEGISPEKIAGVNIETCRPLIYEVGAGGAVGNKIFS